MSRRGHWTQLPDFASKSAARTGSRSFFWTRSFALLCDQTTMARKRIGELLLERGAITVQQLEEALAHHRQTRQRLGAALIQKGFLTEEQLVKVLSEALGISPVDLRAITPDWSAIHMVRARFCETHDLFPYAVTNQRGRKQ